MVKRAVPALGRLFLVVAFFAGCAASPSSATAPSKNATPAASFDPTPVLTDAPMTPPPETPNLSSSDLAFPERPDWPGAPTMTAGGAVVPSAGEGGCGSVFYQERAYAADQCGPGSFPLDATPAKVGAHAALAIAYADGTLVTDRTFSGESVDFSVLASLVSSLRDLPVGQQDQLPSGRATLDLRGHLGSSGEVLATGPKAVGDYLIQVTGAVRVGDWTWTGVRFYYRLFVR